MRPINQPANTKICPTCGTCLSGQSTRCAVCGHIFTSSEGTPAQNPPARSFFSGAVLNLPVLLGFLLLVLVANTAIILSLEKRAGKQPALPGGPAGGAAAGSLTAPPPGGSPAALTATPEPTRTRVPSPTVEPNIEYKVVSGDSCLSISKRFNVDIATLVRMNDLDCALLPMDKVLDIPRPTATPLPPGATAPPEGEQGAPSLLQPANGAAFVKAGEAIILQWSGPAPQADQSYTVTVKDLTAGEARAWTVHTNESRYIVPESYRSTDGLPHIYAWTVQLVKKKDTAWEPAGPLSEQRVFSWMVK